MCQLELIDLFANKPHINHARCFEHIGNPLLICALRCAPLSAELLLRSDSILLLCTLLGAICLHVLAAVLDALGPPCLPTPPLLTATGLDLLDVFEYIMEARASQ